MPKVPEEAAPSFSTQVPGVTFPMHQEFGKIGQAAEHLGEDVGQASSTASNIINEVQRQQAISTSENAAVQDNVDHAKFISQLKINNPDGLIHDPSTADDQNPAGKVIFNSDQTPRTITQEYYDWANQRYQDHQDNMTPMAAAMYRQRALPEIGSNMKMLDNDRQAMQLNAADQSQQRNFELLSGKYNTSAFGSQQDPHMPDVQAMSSDVLTLNAAVQKTGPINTEDSTQTGLRNLTDIAAIKTKQASEFANQFMSSTLMKWNTDENPGGSTVSTTRLNNMKAVVKGEDPTSQALAQKGLPTVANSLTTAQQTAWLNKLNDYGATAVKVDKSDFENQLENFIAGARNNTSGYRSGEASPALTAIQQAMSATKEDGTNVMGFTDADKIHKVWSPIISAQVVGHLDNDAAFSTASTATQHALADKEITRQMALANQLAQASGHLLPVDRAQVLLHEVSGNVASEINKMDAEKRSDLAGFLTKPVNPNQAINQQTQYRNPVMAQLSQMDASNIPKLTSSGMLPRVLNTMDRATKVNFGGITPTYMPQNTYQQMAGAFTNPNNTPERQQKFLDNLRAPTSQGGAGNRFGLLLHQMVTNGGLDPRYEQVANIPTITGQIAAIGAIQAGGGNTKAYAEAKDGETPENVNKLAQAQLAPYIKNTLLSSFDNNAGMKQANVLKQTWADEYSKIMLANPGMNKTDAASSATQATLAHQNTYEPIQAYAHDWFGVKFGQIGAKTQVSLPPNYSDQQKAIVKQNLLDAQSAATIAKAGVVLPPPDKGQYDFRDKATPEWINQHAVIWVPEHTASGTAYSLRIQGTNPDNTPNGRPQWLMRKLPDGSLSKYTVSEKDALTPRVPDTPMAKPMPIYKGK